VEGDEESEVEGFLEESGSAEDEEGEEDEATEGTSTMGIEEETTWVSTGVTEGGEEGSFGVVVSGKTVATLVERGLSFFLTETFEGDFLVELMTESKSSIENF
jgi:hypothetical protein